jgi:hypothetical protein
MTQKVLAKTTTMQAGVTVAVMERTVQRQRILCQTVISKMKRWLWKETRYLQVRRKRISTMTVMGRSRIMTMNEYHTYSTFPCLARFSLYDYELYMPASAHPAPPSALTIWNLYYVVLASCTIAAVR